MTAYIAGYARTPYTKMNGALASLSAVRLGALAIEQALLNAQIATGHVDLVVGGHVIQTGCGQNPARQSAVAAGIRNDVPALTINSVCLSGADAVIWATQQIELGLADVVVVVGQESMSNAPHALRGSRQGHKYGAAAMIDTLEIDGLTDAFSGESMGLATQKVSDAAGLTREEMDRFAVASHQRAEASRDWVNKEIAPITIGGRGGDTVVSTDDGIRTDISMESVGALRPAFSKDGTITAANSSPLTDGAAALVVVSEKWKAKYTDGPYLAEVVASARVAGPDYSLNLQPANAIKAALKRAGLTVSDLNQIEINEAFAAVGVASTADLGIDPARVNVDGGAIAIGHPIGSSGARIVGHLARNLKREGAGTIGAVGICGGGGQGVGVVLRAL